MAYIKGIFLEDIFKNESNGYTVGLIRIKETDTEDMNGKVVTFTGIFDDLKYKQVYKMTGEFVNHPKYGKQFKTDTYEIVMPTDTEELIEFLSSDLFPIGEKTAEKIVDRLGTDAINKIIDDPNVLVGIPRLSDKKILKIVKVLNDYQSTSKILMSLNKLGFSTKDSLLILKKYGSSTEKVIDKNIYSVIDDTDITFDEVDKIASGMGYLEDDERRLEALTIHAIKIITFDHGDTYLYFDEIYNYVSKHASNIDRETLEYILLKLSKLNKIKIEKDRYYLYEFYEAEHYIVNRLIYLNDLERRKLPKLDTKINAVEFLSDITYDDSQRDAIKKALNNNLTIITGGPGTGKTTIIKCIVSLLIDIMGINKNKLALLAPTGRAARKLMELTNTPAYTIHKYLKWDKDSNKFGVDEYNPNNEDYIIVDEASMIDTMLLYGLFKGTRRDAKYIFVGDYYQLPSVREGQILKDMIDSDTLDVIKLNKLYRQNENSYINVLASEIKNKELSDNFLNKYDDYNFIECRNDEITSLIKDIIKKALDKGYTEKDIQVLAPMYKTTTGIDSLNKILQELMNPPSKNKNEITSGEIIYREGDKILQLVNDPDNGVSNGDLGYIESIISSSKSKSKKNEITINFDGIRVTYTPKDFINIMHGYAISVHKSQGGEFKMVIIPFSRSYKRMLYNKLVYTAITRAKQTLILLGDVNSFIYGVNNDEVELRKTTIKELLEIKYN